ncbi:hypothetical protein DN748_03980 [Sinomicrobium soli]|nr:hypothetical protein DN748_03980 [Sinomicrobium sp. N-1-3-6]
MYILILRILVLMYISGLEVLFRAKRTRLSGRQGISTIAQRNFNSIKEAPEIPPIVGMTTMSFRDLTFKQPHK